MKCRFCAVFVLAFIVLYSCKKEGGSTVDQEQVPIVTVKGQTLYKGELKNVVPQGLSSADSTIAAQAYIKMWINDQLMYEKAKQNIVNEDEIEQLVEDYKKSLITNAYQEQLLREHFSKTVSDKDLQAYYEQNKERFKLKENIIKGLYLKVPVDSKELPNFQKWYKQTTDAAIQSIEDNTLQNAIGYEYFYNKWVSFNVVFENMPLSIENSTQYLQGNKNIEVRDSSFVYLLNIKEYKLIGTEAPYDYMKSQLSDIYIEQRRSDYLKQVKQDLYDKAVSNDDIKFYKE